MTTCIDVAADTSSHLDCLKAARVTTIARYYQYVNHPDLPSKKLSWREAVLIGASGLQIVAVWESGLPVNAAYFSFEKGRQDGLGALQQAFVVGQTKGSAIYWTVDYDAAPVDFMAAVGGYSSGPIVSYFEGVAESLADTYQIGVYGSGAVCQEILSQGLAKYAWLAGASGWRGSKTFTQWNIKQGLQTSMCGLTVDPNEVNGECGSFVPQAQGVV